ncbi:MAG: hypothetical protein A2583_11475 [Bdellovibrionales bacterium RIFOXYD1_FULL_53_11]|nr:MAG: hypothetical protein A2583_11475 [Bdellovibrionales bacterium RIFOXYD1_FULL_53_11]
MFLGQQSQNLENAFFLTEDAKLIEKLQLLKKIQENKEELRKVSGISHDAILDKLVNLGIQAETMAAMTAVPLVEVAWADGSVDASERSEILSRIEKHGIGRDSVEYALLERWLEHKPDSKLLAAWIHYMEGLCHELSAGERQQLRDDLLEDVRAIANSSGGLFGLAKTSKAEQEVINKLEAAFS